MIQKQLTGQIFEDAHPKIKIIEFQNLADFSSQPVSSVPIDEPLFDPLPPIIQFTDYEVRGKINIATPNQGKGLQAAK